ncbi:hypothetical protein [Roseateles asaccharophilus]|uniref:Uncharacterized protein n=1 Tax=Roseateles asaccharophilus TaxID=582607 RepID=A0ABU2ADM7_9BURK|nr:hypothetical protein [Roseateles asaccharophilus]MDR7335215.1 hypothetical protein [Roseateles asaccharophilus]
MNPSFTTRRGALRAAAVQMVVVATCLGWIGAGGPSAETGLCREAAQLAGGAGRVAEQQLLACVALGHVPPQTVAAASAP